MDRHFVVAILASYFLVWRYLSTGETRMVLHEYWAHWPARVTIGDAAEDVQIPPKADLGDVIVKVVNYCPGELRLRLRHSKYCEYTVMLPVPHSAQQKIILDIVRKKDMTLRELGEIRIS
jgi:hypothetical protein